MNKKILIFFSLFVLILGMATWLFLINSQISTFDACLVINSSKQDIEKCEVKSTYKINGNTISYVRVFYKGVPVCEGGLCQSDGIEKNLLVEPNGNITAIVSPVDYDMLSRIARQFPSCGENLTVKDDLRQKELRIDLVKNGEKYFWQYNFNNYIFSKCNLNGNALLGMNNKESDFNGLNATFVSSKK